MFINKLTIPESELKITHIRAPGPGGQNVNKVATGVLLRFNVTSSSLPEEIKARLHDLFQHKLTATGDLLIKATQYRTQDKNKQEALQRLKSMIHQAVYPPKKRQKTQPPRASIKSRLAEKKVRATQKTQRKKHNLED